MAKCRSQWGDMNASIDMNMSERSEIYLGAHMTEGLKGEGHEMVWAWWATALKKYV